MCQPTCLMFLGCYQEKRSAYAPSEEQPVRYDGVYRIAAAYRKAVRAATS